jgi:RNA polymerase sigma-70 factor (ECF subfamily)
MSFAMRLTRFHREDAEDLVQSTMLQGWRKQALFQDGTNLCGWLLFILHNINLDRLRSRQSRGGNAIQVSLEDAHEESVAPAQEHRVMLAECGRFISKLTRASSSALYLTALGFSQAEIARWNKAPLATIRSRIARARRSISVLANSSP